MGCTVRWLITKRMTTWIRNMVLTWPGETISWKEVCAVVTKEYPAGHWRRQTLSRNKDIQAAFESTKRRLHLQADGRRTNGKAPRRAPSDGANSGTWDYHLDEIAKLHGRIAGLEKTIAGLERQFVRWQANADKEGLTLQKLDAPIPRADLGWVDK